MNYEALAILDRIQQLTRNIDHCLKAMAEMLKLEEPVVKNEEKKEKQNVD